MRAGLQAAADKLAALQQQQQQQQQQQVAGAVQPPPQALHTATPPPGVDPVYAGPYCRCAHDFHSASTGWIS